MVSSRRAPIDDNWFALNRSDIHFQYGRNLSSTNAAEKVGSTYRLNAFGMVSANRDNRYAHGARQRITIASGPGLARELPAHFGDELAGVFDRDDGAAGARGAE